MEVLTTMASNRSPDSLWRIRRMSRALPRTFREQRFVLGVLAPGLGDHIAAELTQARDQKRSMFVQRAPDSRLRCQH